jgi:predicted permease
MDKLWQDLRYALRMLAKQPGFAVVAIFTLALGIGANTAIFSVMNAVLLRFLPVPNPQQVFYLHTGDIAGSQSGYGDTSLPEPVFENLRKQTDVFSDLMAYVPLSFSKVAVRYGAIPQEAEADMVSGNFFSGLGVQPVAGRGFTMEDESNHTLNAVLSYAFWTGKLGREPGIIGKAIYIKSVPFTVVGVMPPDFIGVDHGRSTDVWIPLQSRADLKPWGHSAADTRLTVYGSPDWWFLLEIGRLRPGISQQQALARLDPIFDATLISGGAINDPEAKAKPPKLFFTTARGIEGVNDDYQQPLYVLMAMVGLVLVIACANVGMLLVARNAARQREFTLRLALGGTRVRLFRQLLTESLILVLSGAFFGWIFALWATHALAAWSELNLDLQPDKFVLFFTLAISMLAGLAFGLAPLRRISRVAIGTVLKTSTSTSNTDRGKSRSAQAVIALQMALCLTVLVGAGLLVRTLHNLENTKLGLRTQGLYVFGVSPPASIRNNSEMIQFYRLVIERMHGITGVESVTLMDNRIGGGVSNNTGAYVDGVNPNGDRDAPMRWNPVGPDYFHVLGVPLIAGRDVSGADGTNAPKVAVINKTFADRYLAKQNPIGHHLALSDKSDADQYTIVGVAADSKYTQVQEKARPMAYIPYVQVGAIATMHVEVHSTGNVAALVPEMQRVMRQLTPDAPILQPMTQQAQFDMNLSEERLNARLSMFFGFLSALLVAIGLYGTLAYRVARRTSEIGVRMALGAQRRQVLWMVLRESLIVSAVGIAIGLPLAFTSARLLGSMLYGLSASDPITYIVALAGATLVALAASAIPARRASSVDPIIALRHE